MPPLPDLEGLPAWVSYLAYAVLAISIGLGGAAARFGFLHGKSGGSPSAPAAEIKAMAISDAAVDRLTGEVSGLAVAMTALAKATEDNSEAVTTAGTEIREAAREMRELGREISKARP